MKIRISIIAVAVFLAAGTVLYLCLGQSSVGQPLFHKSEESVVPDDNSDLDKTPTPQNKKSPDKNPSVHFHTIVVLLGKYLPTADS